MQGYVITLIGTVIICSLATMLAPEENGMLGYVKLAAGLCVLCVAIAPLSSFAREMFDFRLDGGFVADGEGDKNKWSEIYEGSLISASEESISEGLSAMICREFGLSGEEIDVSVKLSGEGKAQRATVTLASGKAIFADPHRLIDYVTELLGCGCEIIYGQ